MKNAIYNTGLTDAQWDYHYFVLPKLSKRGRPPTDRRRILVAILYVVKRGIPWRYLPGDFHLGKPVTYHALRKWTLNPDFIGRNRKGRLGRGIEPAVQFRASDYGRFWPY